MELSHIKAITEVEMVAELYSMATEIAPGGGDLNIDWIRSHKWVVVPTESGINARDEEWLLNALAAYGYEELFAVVTEPEPINYQSYLVPVNRQALFEAFKECVSQAQLYRYTVERYFRRLGLSFSDKRTDRLLVKNS